jgi:quercetin dioxygenase-like cupin family protein
VGDPTIVDLLAVEHDGPDGAVWSLPHGGDLDANLVHLDARGRVGEHDNREVDVLIVGVSGTATVVTDGVAHALRAGVAIAVPKGTRRAVEAGDSGPVAYLTVHRARSGLSIRPGRPG